MGLLDPLYWAVAWVLVTWHSFLSLILPKDSGAAWSLSIVGLVLVIRILLIPLFVKQIKAQRALQILQPEIKALQKRFKDDRQKQSEEMMKLYRENGTNPFSSCLPIILQMPIFFALFHVLKYGVAEDNPIGPMTQTLVNSAGHATIFGAPISVGFLGSDDTNVKIVSGVLIVLMTFTTFITQKQLMVKGIANADSNPFLQQQKLLVYVFPFMFAIFGINFPIGVLIYWLTTNLWSMGQQYWVIRNNPAPGSQAFTEWEERQERKAAKKGGVDDSAPTIVEDAPVAEPEPRVVRHQPKRKPRSQRRGRSGGAEPSPNEETP
ncbi:MAG: membrane protein insertase YidC [Actinomycetia bacterium]|nr:membrane protein insertase YidC [Actinomycetes bacterium]